MEEILTLANKLGGVSFATLLLIILVVKMACSGCAKRRAALQRVVKQTKEAAKQTVSSALRRISDRVAARPTNTQNGQ